MKKRIFSFFLVFCMALSLIPTALANENAPDTGTETRKMEISGRERTDTGLKCQVSVTGFASGDALLAVALQASGKMKTAFPVALENGSATLTLDDVEDSDTVKIIWTDANHAVLSYKETSRPEATDEFGSKEAGSSAFSQNALNLIARPQYLSAAAEKELDATEKKAETDDYAYKRLIVSADGKLPDLSAYGKPTVYTDASSGYSILQFGTEENAKACEAYLASLPTVQYVEPDNLFKSGPKDSQSALGADEAEFMSWGVTKIKADVLAKYLKSQGSQSKVIVAVADTGVEADHPFLKGRLTKGFDFIENDDDPNDQHSHGTHVSGTIVDCTLGLDNILIMPIRVLGASGGGTAIGIALGIRYAADNGANVINLSLGGGHSNYMDDAISYAISKGVTVVVAAGNEGNDVMAHCPAHVEDAITVAALNSSDERASFSNYGAAVDVAAPGVQIKSSVLNKGYANKSGTSMAAPHVAAAAAMVKFANPDMSPADIQKALKDTATDLGDSGWDRDYGYGLINLESFTKPAKTYSLTYKATEDGGEVSGPASAKAGQTVKLTVSPKEGFALESLSVTDKDGKEISVRDNAFSMPESNVTVTASFVGAPTGTHQIYYKSSEGGEVTGPATAVPGDEVTVTAIAYDGYALKAVSVDGKSIGATLSAADNGGETTTFAFTMPDHDVTVEATFEKTDEPQPDPDPVTGHTYELFETGLVWDEAKAYCEKLGGHLMTVTSAEEQKILEDLLEKEGNRNSYWLGATKGADGNYAWITGEAFSYTNWANNQPDKHHDTEDSLMVYRNQNPYASSNLGEWNDLDHDGTCLDEAFFGLENFGFICEWDGDDDKPVEPVKQYVITATAGEGGEISPSGAVAVNEGASQAFTILPNSGYKISSVEADGKNVGAVSSYEFPSVNADHTIAAYFEKDAPATEGIFAVLYQDGELVFQNDDKPRQDKAVFEIYPVDGQTVKEGVLDIEDDDGDVSSEFGVAYAEWYDHAEIITKVTILDKIQPTSTALWFHDCKKLTTITGLEKLDTSKVTNMSHMFSKCALLPAPDLSGFDTSNVTNMSHMFYGCKSFKDLYLESFDTSAVTDMGAMFSGCTALHRVYVSDNFVTTAVTASSKMFSNCSAIEGTYGTKFDKAHVDKEYARLDDPAAPPVAPGYFSDSLVIDGVANVYLYSDGELVFQLRKKTDPARTLIASYTIDVVKRDNVSSVDYALWNEHSDKIMFVTFADPIRPYATSQWFYGCRNLKKFRNMANLDTRYVTDMSMMFSGCAALPSLDLSNFNTAKVTSMKSMFENCAALTALDVSGFDTAGVTNMSAMFQGCSALKSLSLDAFNVSKVTNMSNMFRDCASLTALDLSAFNTASVTSMDYMFRGCAKLAKLDVSKFNTSKVSDMKYLFSGCASLASLDLSAFNTANVTDMRHMFSGCASMKTLDVSKFNTAKVTNMSGMFEGAKALGSLDVSGFDAGKVTDMSRMFAETGMKELDLSALNVANVTNMSGMFQGSAVAVLNLTQETNSAWNTGKVTNTENMFRGCSALTTINVAMGTFSTDAVTNSANMFTGSAKLVGGRGTAYDAAHIDKEYARIDFGKRQPGYFTDPNMLVLTFNPNDSAEDPATGVMEEQLFSKGVAETLSPNQFSREGYDFKGWNTKPDGSGKAYADEASITLTDDLTLYAQWDYSYMENFYAILYSDGELVFQWNDKPESGRSVVKTYVTDRQGYSENRAEQNNFRAWHNEAAQIKTATFAKRIQPDDIAQWFQDCSNLTTIRNLQKLDTSLVTDMSNLFAGCGSLKEADLSAFNTSKVTSMEFMFEDCGSLTVADLSAFDTAKVSRMGAMFSGCEELTTIYASAKFVTSAVTDDMEGEDMFMDCWNLVGGSGTAFDEDCTDMTYARIDGGASNPGYFTAG